MFNCTVSNATLSPKSSMATPGRTWSPRGRRTLSTRFPKSLVGAWANSCRVRGRLSLVMMARPKSSKACSIGSIPREQVMVPAPAHMLQEIISLQQPYMDKCCFHKFFLGVKGRSFPEYPATWMRWRFHPEPPMTFSFMNTDPYHHWAAIT